MAETYTAAELTEAITRALADHNVKAAVALLRRMAVQHPREAQEVLDTINLGMALRSLAEAELAKARQRIAAVEAVCNDPGGPDSWSHTFQGRQAVFADDVLAALSGEPS